MGWLYSLIVRVLSLMKSLNIHYFSLLSLSKCEHTENVSGMQLPLWWISQILKCEHTENVSGMQPIHVLVIVHFECEHTENVSGMQHFDEAAGVNTSIKRIINNK